MLKINSENLTYVVITLLVLFTIVYLYVYKNDTLEDLETKCYHT
jgi:hypothetical protein